MRLRQLVACLSVAIWIGHPALALPKEKSKWLRVDTENFYLLGNASESRNREVGKGLEILRDVLSRMTPDGENHSPLSTKVYVFKNPSSFRDYNIRQDGKPADISAFFIKSIDGNYIALNSAGGSDLFYLVYHEYLHYFLANNFPDLPLWLIEGLAEFYSTFAWRGSNAELGHPIQAHINWLGSNSLIPP